MKKSDFYYALPENLIAQKPLPERGASRLLVLDTSSENIMDHPFSDFIDLVNDKDLLVFNDTRVIPARLYGRKLSGGKVEILIERLLTKNEAIAHVRASKAPKPGSVIKLDNDFSCEVTGREDDLFRLKFILENCTLFQLLERIGHVPLPPYIARADEEEDWNRYQTVFARQNGAVAAPTAGLHFDQSLMDLIKARGIATAFITLHVGSGTFQPVRVENLSDHHMHTEYFEVPQTTVAAVDETRKRGGRVIAIGTTSVRALESASTHGKLKSGYGDTDLFITPGYRFQSVDALLTNFHLPESTLLMLVSAFAGYEFVKKAYQHAVNYAYRFFSYGDAMFITSLNNRD